MWSSSTSQCNVIDTKRGNIFHISSSRSIQTATLDCCGRNPLDILDITMATNEDISDID